MPDFQYTAREISGREVTGLLTAGSEQEAVNSLAVKSLFPRKSHWPKPRSASSRR